MAKCSSVHEGADWNEERSNLQETELFKIERFQVDTHTTAIEMVYERVERLRITRYYIESEGAWLKES